MKEIKPIKNEKAEIPSVKEEPEKKPLVKQVKELSDFKNKVESGEIKTRKLRVPKKAKVRRGRLKKGYIGILKIDENRNITAEKQRVSGFAFKTGDNIYHTTDGREIFFWNGRYPLVIQPSWKNNPMQINPKEEKNETYGQPYIKAKLLADTIKVKKKGGGIIIWILLGVAALIGINYIVGGNLFG